LGRKPENVLVKAARIRQKICLLMLSVLILPNAPSQRSEFFSSTPQPCSWRLLGPINVPEGEGYDGSRVSVSGRVSSIAVDQVDPDTVYVGSALGGVWKSRDGGQSWSPRSDSEASLAIGALAISQLERTIYVGTGEGNLAFRQQMIVGDRPLSGHRGRGLLKSINGAETWQLLGEKQFSGAAFSELAISPHRAQSILAGTTAGLFLSNDGGQSWLQQHIGEPASSAQVMATSTVFDPASEARGFAAFWGRGIFRAEDLDTALPRWTQLTRGLPLSNVGRIGLSTSPASPKTVYALISDIEGRLRGFYVSEDSGDSWIRVPNAPDLLQQQGFFNLTVAAHPLKANTVFLAGAGNRQVHPSSLYRGTLQNGVWQFFPIGSHIHIDVHAISFHPHDEKTFYVGTDGGVWKTTDGGQNWMSCNKGLVTMQFNTIAQHPESASFIVGGTQDNGTVVFNGSTDWAHVDDGDGGFVAVDPKNPRIVYNEFSSYKIARSERTGEYGSFIPIYPKIRSPRSVFFAPFAVSPETTRTLVLGMERLYLTDDAGRNWMPISEDLTGPRASNLHINAISALLYPRSDLIYVGTSDGKVWQLQNRANLWIPTELTAAQNHPPSNRVYVTDLALVPGRSNELYVSFEKADPGSLWHCSVNERRTIPFCVWSSRSGTMPAVLSNVPVFTVEADTTNSLRLYVGTEDGVYRSEDGGESWQAFRDGLPRTSVFDLQMHPKFNVLRAATHGRGVWERDVSIERCNSTNVPKPSN
jgi:photosystem II stability/assembly factor-like uncharacterized protein